MIGGYELDEINETNIPGQFNLTNLPAQEVRNDSMLEMTLASQENNLMLEMMDIVDSIKEVVTVLNSGMLFQQLASHQIKNIKAQIPFALLTVLVKRIYNFIFRIQNDNSFMQDIFNEILRPVIMVRVRLPTNFIKIMLMLAFQILLKLKEVDETKKFDEFQDFDFTEFEIPPVCATMEKNYFLTQAEELSKEKVCSISTSIGNMQTSLKEVNQNGQIRFFQALLQLLAMFLMIVSFKLMKKKRRTGGGRSRNFKKRKNKSRRSKKSKNKCRSSKKSFKRNN